ncbi:MAG: hypothetical protein HKN35_13145, partial [Woeseia sp.]|nr:hypothetical protein [Woeseia sp.]
MAQVPATDIRVFTGIDLRRADREKKVDYVRRVTEHGLSEYLPGLARPKEPYTEYEQDLKRFLKELESWSKNANTLKIARAHLARLIHQHNQRNGTELPIPPPLARLFQDRPLRTQRWSEDRRRMNEAHERWLAGLNSPYMLNLSADLRLGQFLYTAATYGCLCRPEALESLADTIQASKPIRNHRGLGTDWIDLHFQHGRFTNATVDDVDVVYEPWPLVSMCKLTAKAFLEQRHQCSWIGNGDRPPAFDLICAAFENAASQKLPFSSLKKFLRVAFCIAERQPGANLPEVLAGYAVGRVASMSARPAS